MKTITLYLVWSALLTSAWSFKVHAHPDSQLDFRQHKTNDGRIIFSNIPKRCFGDGLLTCQHLHPVIGGTILKDNDAPDRAETVDTSDSGVLKVEEISSPAE